MKKRNKKATPTTPTTAPSRRASWIIPWGITLFVLASGCGGSLTTRNVGTRDQHQQPWLPSLFPVTDEQPVRIDRYPGQIVLLRQGRIYGSTGDDMPGQVFGMVAGLTLAPSGPRLLRVGQIGFGTGVSVGVALANGARMVDAFENDIPLVEAGQELASVSGLLYQNNLPTHPALRIVTLERARSERFLRYDLVISPPATSAIVNPGRLITVERLETLSALLSSEGVLVHHLPAYGMQPEVFRRFLRTFARAFPHVMVLAAEPGSGDLFMIGSSVPLRFRPAALRTLSDNPALADLLESAHIDQHMDIAARTVFATREEVLDFAEEAESISARTPLSADDLPPPPAMPPPQAPEPEQQAWQQAWRQHQSRFERLDLLRQEMFGLDWTFGQICPDGPTSRRCLLAELGANPGTHIADLILSLMAAGRFVEARVTLETTAQQTSGPELDASGRVLELLLGDPRELTDQLPETLPEIRSALELGQCEVALQAAEGPMATTDDAGDDERLVLAYTLVRCRSEEREAMEMVAELLQPLFENDEGPPLQLYLSSRASMVLGNYRSATWSMQVFAQTEPPPPRPAQPTEPEDLIIE